MGLWLGRPRAGWLVANPSPSPSPSPKPIPKPNQVSVAASPPEMAHDFCGWLEVSTADGSETLLRHEWQAECADTPPGKLLRLLKALPLPGLEQS